MANILQAIQAYGPRVELSLTAKTDDIATWMAMRTALNNRSYAVGYTKRMLSRPSEVSAVSKRRFTR